ncbi:hypothetical protein FAM09_05295 [Niastella caeni]|uniref:Uncharacterized protein n=1 Tax=Niastella caeni TaxID=2569763 RepID=A0A4S8I3F8_9BACT|nr:hypothetical protein [Niastella caeni]THU41524.1 hypothetical protein FAM09_05295 [Niastella caeni]
MNRRTVFIRSIYCLFLFLSLGSSFCGYTQSVSVSVNKSGFTEIRNGLLGIVIPGEAAIKAKQFNLAPIQSFIYANGVYSDNTINYLNTATPPVSLAIKILTRSESELAVQLEYRFQKKKTSDPGFYNCSITVRKGEKTILIEEYTDNDLTYNVKISNGLAPDKARYRGWSSDSKEYGYEPGGELYRPENKRGAPMDATVDLNYGKPVMHPRLSLWDPAGGEVNTGRYWQVYNSRDNSSNLFGFFQGKPSRLIGAKFAGPALQTRPSDPDDKGTNDAELHLSVIRVGPDNSYFPRKRFQWVAFISTKKDLLSPEKIQPIGIELNRVSGLGAVIREYLNKPVKLIPAFYKGAIYTSVENIEGIYKRIKRDESFYQSLCQAEGGYKDIFDVWRYPIARKNVLKGMLEMREQLVQQYTVGEGTYDFNNRYWMGARNFKYYTMVLSCLLADPETQITAEERKKLEQLVGLMARIMWDDNNIPLFDSSGVNFGPANMSLQFRNNSRTFFALLLADDPEFKERARKAASDINKDINEAIYENGASIGSPHYTQPSIEPILFSMLQIKQAGVADLFKTNERVKKFARFYSSLLTPPSCRFSGNRKLISFGDGSEESSAIFAILATGFQRTDTLLSEQLLSLYYNGPARFSTAGSIILASNFSREPRINFNAYSCNYTGYMSHFRSGLNSTDETALWVLNGERYYDHRMDDAGEIAIYALQAPLSVAWSSFYYPHATDARIKSVVVPEQLFPQWKTANQPIAERSLTNRTWPASSSQQFAKLGYSNSTTVQMKREGQEWYRQVSMIVTQTDAPVIIMYDSIKGNGSAIWNMPMMSDGTVTTDAGAVLPVKKLYNNGDRKELPEATTVKDLSAGLHRFSFTGQAWPAHPTGGINWHLFSSCSEPIQFTLSAWANFWQNDVEQREFLKTNGRNYSEEQQILRLKSSRPFFSILLPYKKGIDPYNNRVKQLPGNEISIEINGDDLIVTPTYYYLKKKQGAIMGVLTEKGSLKKDGWQITGGFIEIEYNAQKVKVRVHGNSGKRSIQFPFPVTPVKKYANVISAGNNQLLIIDYTAKSTDLENGEQGFTEYLLERK